MRTVFLLEKTNLALAEAEALSLINGKKIERDENLLVAENSSKEALKRLAFTSKAYRFLFSCPPKNLIKEMKSFNWDSIYKKNFSLRMVNLSSKKTGLKEKELAGFIWRSVEKPKVDLEKPKTAIEFLILEDKIVGGLLISRNKGEFEQRKAHKRPAHHPTSLHPKLARCMVNLTGAMKGETMVDPFCGSGGILIEAGLMGLKAVGCDIDKRLLEKARINLAHYKIRNFKLIRRDALKMKEKADYLATDLPYGRNTEVKEPEKLYSSFLKKLRKVLGKRAVVSFPDSIPYRKLIVKNKLKLKNSFEWYLHKSLSKRICVIER